MKLDEEEKGNGAVIDAQLDEVFERLQNKTDSLLTQEASQVLKTLNFVNDFRNLHTAQVHCLKLLIIWRHVSLNHRSNLESFLLRDSTNLTRLYLSVIFCYCQI